jgi:hypothetical protein
MKLLYVGNAPGQPAVGTVAGFRVSRGELVEIPDAVVKEKQLLDDDRVTGFELPAEAAEAPKAKAKASSKTTKKGGE